MASMFEQLVDRLDGMQADLSGSIATLAGRMDTGEQTVATLAAQMRSTRAQQESPAEGGGGDQQDAPPAPARVLFAADGLPDDPPAPAPAPAPAMAPEPAPPRRSPGTSLSGGAAMN